MKDVLDLVQSTLDRLLAGEGVYTFWGRRADTESNPQATEYVIYSIEGDDAEVSADGMLYYRMMTVSLQYYIKYAVARTYQGRRLANDRMDAMREVMRGAGFGCSGGWAEIGDVDDIGFATFRSEYDIPRLMIRNPESGGFDGGQFNLLPFDRGQNG